MMDVGSETMNLDDAAIHVTRNRTGKEKGT